MTTPAPQTSGPTLPSADVAQAKRGTLKAALAPLLKRGGSGDKEPVRGMSNLPRLFRLALPYKWKMVTALIAVLVTSGMALAGPVMWSFLVDAIVPGGDPSMLGKATLLLIGIYLVQSLASLVSGYYLNVIGLLVTIDLRQKIYEHLHRLSLNFYSERRTGELVSRVMNDVATVRGVVTTDIAGLLSQVIIFIGALVLIILMDWRLTLLMFLMVPAVSIVSIYLGRLVRNLSQQVTDEYASVTTVLEESISGVRTVRSFVREKFEVGRFRDSLQRLLDFAMERLYLQVLFGPLLSVMFFGSTVVIIWFGGKQVLAGRMTTGQLVTFIVLTTTMGGSIRWVGGLWTRLQEALGASHRLFELLDREPSIADAPDAVALPAVDGRITFEGIGFQYQIPDEENPPQVLRDVSLEIAPGEVLAIVGPSGAGKTTLMNLVPRFYDPQAGAVRVDGLDVREVTMASLRTQIGMVPQETQLFGGTVRDNLLYGRLEASEEEMEAAARAANAHDFIVQLPQGYDTVVGERAMKLSGGQRQRIAIARALLKNPRVLLLDEATSALDNESEHLVQEALERLMAGRTTLVIAHRLSTVKNAHRIAVLDSGRLVELGSHEELMPQDGLYARLYRQQFKEGTRQPALVN